MERAKAEEIVDGILLNMTNLGGFDHAWDACDRETRQEIRENWVQIAMGNSQTDKELRRLFLAALYEIEES